MADKAKKTDAAKEPAKGGSTLGLGHVIDSSMQQLVRLGFLACIIAWSLTHTSRSLWLNLPTALVLILSAIWAYSHFNIEINGSGKSKRSGLTIDREEESKGASGQAKTIPASPFEAIFNATSRPKNKSSKYWREQVKSAVVEDAWETLCGSIIQEFVYDLWYNALTPDKEFPKEIRQVLNSAFGELAERARKLDLKGVLLRDVSELLMDQIELYRHTRDSIVRGMDAEAWKGLTEEARERALLAELKADKNLHPALYSTSGTSQILGHYKVLQTVCEGVVAFLLDRSDHAKSMMRTVARELLATCVFRPLLGLITPYNINKLLLLALQKHEVRRPPDLDEVAAAAEANQASTAPSDAAQGWEFAERARLSIQEEQGVSRQNSVTVMPRKHPHNSHIRSEHNLGKRSGGLKQVKSEQNLRGADFQADGAENQVQERHGSANLNTKSGKSLIPGHKSAEPVATSQSTPEHSRTPTKGTDLGNIVLPKTPTGQWTSPGGSCSQLRAMVVAAELNTEGSRDVVMYKIRVANGTNEWTVSRRFRNFEALHRLLKNIPTYRCRLPAKKVFAHSQTVEFVEERRQQLDQYLQQILADPSLTGREEIWEFLSAWSEVYGIDCDQSILGSINASIKDANVNVRRAVGSIVDDVNAKRLQANANLSKLANLGGSESESRESRPPVVSTRSGSRLINPSAIDDPQTSRVRQTVSATQSSGGRQERSSLTDRSLFGPDLSNFVPSIFSRAKKTLTGEEGTTPHPPAADLPRQNVPQTEDFQGHLLHYSKPSSARVSPTSSMHAGQGQDNSANEPSLPGGVVSSENTPAPQQAAPPPGGANGSRQTATPQQAAPSGGANGSRQTPTPQQVAPPGGANGSRPTVAPAADLEAAQTPVKPDPLVQPNTRTPDPAEKTPNISEGTSMRANLAPDSGHIQLAGLPESGGTSAQAIIDNLEAVPPVVVPSSLVKPPDTKEGGQVLLLEEAAGISAPLYDVIDVLFELQSRGIFRRQVYGVARQMLSLIAGGAIDEYILSQLRALRQEHQLARLIHSLQITLWPGGIWFHRLPGRQPPPSSTPPPRFRMTAENFISPPESQPLDEEEIKEAVKGLLMSSGPPALIRIIGRTAYTAGMQNLYDMIQSRTFLHQLGYGLLKIGLVSLMPELRAVFRNIERAPSKTDSQPGKA